MSRVTGDDVLHLAEQTPQLRDWQPLLGTLRARYATGGFLRGVELVQAVAEAAEEANHHPDVTLSYPFVELRLTSHDVGHLTERDVALATRIADIAAGMGLEADRDAVSAPEIALDTWDAAEIIPFWAAVYGVELDEGADEVVDPAGVLPSIWFQDTDEHPEPRMRFHLDLTVPPHVLDPRVQAAVAAGGRVVDDSQAPRFVVLADAQENRVCLCTQVGRDR